MLFFFFYTFFIKYIVNKKNDLFYNHKQIKLLILKDELSVVLNEFRFLKKNSIPNQ